MWWRKSSKILVIFLVALFSVLAGGGAVQAVSKADYVQHVETQADITSAYTIYRVCNPTGSDLVLNSDSDFSVAFTEVKNRLTSWDVKVEEVENYLVDVPIYDFVNVTVNETRRDNETGENITVQKTRRERVQTGINKVPKTRKLWRKFQPRGSSIKANTCYLIRVEGTYPARLGGTKIDNILSFAGYTFDEYAWWNGSWIYRQQINITNNAGSTLEEGYSINISLDHKTLVQNNRSNLDGSDIRIVYTNQSGDFSLDWINTSDFNNSQSQNTTIRFALQENIPAGGYNDSYYIYYGNPNAAAPPNNGDNVFLFWDDFLGTDLDLNKWKTVNGIGVTVSGGICDLQSTDSSKILGIKTNSTNYGPYGVNTAISARMKITSSTNHHFGWWDFDGSSFGSYYTVWRRDSGTTPQLITSSGGSVTGESNPSNDVWYEWTLFRKGTSYFKSERDDGQIMTKTSGLNTNSRPVGFSPYSVSHLYLDWVYVRKYISPEPTAILGEAEHSFMRFINPQVDPASDKKGAVFTFSVYVSSSNETETNVTLHVRNATLVEIFNDTVTLRNITELIEGNAKAIIPIRLNETGQHSYYWHANSTVYPDEINKQTTVFEEPVVFSNDYETEFSIPAGVSKIIAGVYWYGVSSTSGVNISLYNGTKTYIEFAVPTMVREFESINVTLPLIEYDITIYSGYKELSINNPSGSSWTFKIVQTDVNRIETDLRWM